MDNYFPLNKNIKKNDIKSLLITIAIYLVVSIVAGLINTLLGGIPVLGWIIGLVVWLIGLYCLVGIILGIVEYVK